MLQPQIVVSGIKKYYLHQGPILSIADGQAKLFFFLFIHFIIFLPRFCYYGAPDKQNLFI